MVKAQWLEKQQILFAPQQYTDRLFPALQEESARQCLQQSHLQEPLSTLVEKTSPACPILPTTISDQQVAFAQAIHSQAPRAKSTNGEKFHCLTPSCLESSGQELEPSLESGIDTSGLLQSESSESLNDNNEQFGLAPKSNLYSRRSRRKMIDTLLPPSGGMYTGNNMMALGSGEKASVSAYPHSPTGALNMTLPTAGLKSALMPYRPACLPFNGGMALGAMGDGARDVYLHSTGSLLPPSYTGPTLPQAPPTSAEYLDIQMNEPNSQQQPETDSSASTALGQYQQWLLQGETDPQQRVINDILTVDALIDFLIDDDGSDASTADEKDTCQFVPNGSFSDTNVAMTSSPVTPTPTPIAPEHQPRPSPARSSLVISSPAAFTRSYSASSIQSPATSSVSVTRSPPPSTQQKQSLQAQQKQQQYTMAAAALQQLKQRQDDASSLGGWTTTPSISSESSSRLSGAQSSECFNDSSVASSETCIDGSPSDLYFQKTCASSGCQRVARTRGLCKAHGALQCAVEGCTKQSQGGHLCIRHGGGRRCQIPGCDKAAQSKFLCKAHGGGQRCQEDGCMRSSQGGGYCRTHGGGQRCKVDKCRKGAQRDGYCAAHGGVRFCTFSDCDKHDRGGGFCAMHGGGKRCSTEGCEHPARRKGMCTIHFRHG